MEDILALHTAARRFCIEQNTFWNRAYSKLRSEGEAEIKKPLSRTWDYSPSAYSLFPRYRLAQATLATVEQIVPKQSESRENIQIRLEDAGQVALAPLLEEFRKNENALIALRTQATAFKDLLEHLTSNELKTVLPLPYRRTLSKDESTATWDDLKSRWNIQGQGYGWYPISDAVAPEGAIAVHDELWEQRDGDGLLLQFFKENAIERCYIVHELDVFPPDCETDSTILCPRYMGSELFVTTNADWVLYASHESSITLVGSLAQFFRDHWPDCDQLSYGGPYHTPDLRGSWNHSG